MLQAEANPFGNDSGRLDKVTFNINDPHSHIPVLCNFTDDLNFGKFAARHLHMNLIQVHIKKSREHGCIAPVADSMTFEIAKAEMGGEATFAHDGFNRAIENIDKARRVFTVGVATHRRLIDRQFFTAGGDQIFQFFAHDGDERFGYDIAILVLGIGL